MNTVSLPTISLTNILANDQHIILYRPELRKITGSVTATILLQQMVYRWSNHGREPFYKFKEPCNHPKYQDGDSWCEELGFSKFEFDNALKKIGFKRTAKNRDAENTEYPIEYWTDLNRLTHYTIIEGILEKKLHEVYGLPQASNDTNAVPSEFTKIKKVDLPVNQETGFTSITETTTKTTTTKAKPKAVDLQKAPKPSSSFFEDQLITVLATLMALVPEKYRKPSIKKTVEKGLKAHTEDYIRLAILYTLTNSNGGTWQKFKAYLGKTIDYGWADGWEPDQVDQIDKEAIRERFRRMADKDLKAFAELENIWAIEELERRDSL